MFKYADGFRFKKLKEKGQIILVIEATHKKYPNIKLVDYFFIKDTYLYRLSFSVSQQKYFKNYASLFTQMAETFQFINTPAETLTVREGTKTDHQLSIK